MKDYRKALTETFRLSYLRPAQEMIVTRILENAERPERSCCIASLPTGGGKSLCFLLPAAVLDRPAILLYPLRSLMNDQARRLDGTGIPYALLRGGMTEEERSAELRMLRTGEKKIIITNMEMLLWLTKSHRLDFLAGRTELFVMDEAHTVIQWKDGFRPAYARLGSVIGYLRPHQALCFTATLDEDMKEELRKLLFPDMEPEEFTLSPDRENAFYHRVLTLSRREDLRKILSPQERRPAVVFCRSRRECEEWNDTFSSSFPCACYHAGLDAGTRRRTEEEFHRSDSGIIFATNAYGMGVDKKNIRTVIHTYLPRDPLSFLQESGRGGRDGQPFDSFVLIQPGASGPMKDIFLGSSCIRNALLAGSGNMTETGRCTSCSVCAGERYIPAGRSEMLRAMRRLPFLNASALARFLKSPLAGRDRLTRWSGIEIRQALIQLRKERHGRRRKGTGSG